MRKVILFTSTNIKWAVLDIENSPFFFICYSRTAADNTNKRFVKRNRITGDKFIKPNSAKEVWNPNMNDSFANKTILKKIHT